MGVKWVKIARHDGGLDFARLLLRNDIMPIVRLYRPQPNPGTLDAEALAAVKDYVAAGVRYFEFNNEPDLGVEWQGNIVPPNAIEIVARQRHRRHGSDPGCGRLSRRPGVGDRHQVGSGR